MIVKPYAAGEELAQLAELALAEPSLAARIDVEIKKRKAGEKAEREVAYLIDFEIKETGNWAVIHNLRIEVGDFVAQIDHLLIDRMLNIYLLETKNFSSGLKITEEGEFLRWDEWKRTFIGMDSPIAQGERHAKILRRLLDANDFAPRRLGVKLSPRIVPYVVVSKNARVDRPQRFDTSCILKSDQIFAKVQNETPPLTTMLSGIAKIVSADTLREFATALSQFHRPIVIDHAARLGVKPPLQSKEAARPDTAENSPDQIVLAEGMSAAPAACASCKSCESTNLEIRAGRFGYYWKCLSCDANTKVLLSEGQKLRKSGLDFYLVDTNGEQSIFHRNGSIEARAIQELQEGGAQAQMSDVGQTQLRG